MRELFDDSIAINNHYNSNSQYSDFEGRLFIIITIMIRRTLLNARRLVCACYLFY